MKININELNVKRDISIKDNFIFSDEDIKNVGVKRVDNCYFDGSIYFNSMDEIVLSGTLEVVLIMEDAIDLSDYEHKITCNIEEIVENFENILDINEILWENIVLEVPVRVTNKKLANISGDGWKVMSEEDLEVSTSKFDKLKELYEGGE